MKLISLTQGKFALVDDADFDRLTQHKWSAYRRVTKGKTVWYAIRKQCTRTNRRTTVYMHRQVLGVTDPKVEVDHRDSDGLNNQRKNLRIATHAQNQQNSRKQVVKCSSQFKGVYKHKDGKWIAQIKVPGERVQRYLGSFENEHEAAEAYD